VSGVASAASFGSWRERRGAGLRGQRGAGGAGASAGRHAAWAGVECLLLRLVSW